MQNALQRRHAFEAALQRRFSNWYLGLRYMSANVKGDPKIWNCLSWSFEAEILREVLQWFCHGQTRKSKLWQLQNAWYGSFTQLELYGASPKLSHILPSIRYTTNIRNKHVWSGAQASSPAEMSVAFLTCTVVAASNGFSYLRSCNIGYTLMLTHSPPIYDVDVFEI
jgi:hypothetical protein